MTKTLALILSASLAACAGTTEVRYSASVATPELVAISPSSDVMVVADSDEPVFYVNAAYWLFRNNSWYRSDSYRDGNWIRIATPPTRLHQIDQPYAFAHFRRGDTHARATLDQPAREQREREQREAHERNQAEIERDQRERAKQQEFPHSGNSPGPQPYPNPLPPQQVPPTAPYPDRDDQRATAEERTKAGRDREATDRTERERERVDHDKRDRDRP